MQTREELIDELNSDELISRCYLRTVFHIADIILKKIREAQMHAIADVMTELQKKKITQSLYSGDTSRFFTIEEKCVLERAQKYLKGDTNG